MDKLFAWLRVEPKGSKLFLFFAVVLIGDFSYSFLVGNILKNLGIQLNEGQDSILALLKEMPIIFLGVLLPLMAMFEELFFRLPLVLLTDKQPKTILIGAIFLSVIFGYAHGGWQHIPLQGFGGLVLCLVFLKCGGLQEKPEKAFLSSSFMHLAFNWLVSIFVLLDPAQA